MRQRWTVEWRDQFGRWETIEAFVFLRNARKYLARRVVDPFSVRAWRIWDVKRNRCELYVVRHEPREATNAD